MKTNRWRLIKADLLGNDDDGYDWNDNIDCGTYDLPECFFYLSDSNARTLQWLVEEGVFDKQALKAATVEIEWQDHGDEKSGSFYIDFYFPQNAPRSKESFELRLEA